MNKSRGRQSSSRAQGRRGVKSSTGFQGKPTTVEMVRIMKDAVGDTVKVKASGGIRSLDTLLEMADAGAERFGLGVRGCDGILRETAIKGSAGKI